MAAAKTVTAITPKRGRQAALEQLAEKQLAAGVAASGGGAGLLSPAAGAPSPSFGAASPSAGPSGGGTMGLALERSTFAERVADIKDNVERARSEYRSKATSALGSAPSQPSAVTAAMHNKFADLEAMWGEVMDYASIDPFSTATPGVRAAASSLSRNRAKLDMQVNAIMDDLWDGVSSGQAWQMNDRRKDAEMEKILGAQGTAGARLSPGGYGGAGGMPSFVQQMEARSPGPRRREGMDGLLQMPTPWQQREQEQVVEYAPPPAGAQDFETRRQLEIMRQDIMRLEEQVLQAVEAEEEALPPPPPLIQKQKAGIVALQKAADYEDIVYKIQNSAVGSEGDCGSTPCNSVDDPNMPLIMPRRGGMKIRHQIEALQKETEELKEVTINEFGGMAAKQRMHEMQREMKKAIKKKR